MQSGGNKARRLVLHFDVNKTIIMKDTSNSLHSVELTVSYLKFTLIK